MSVNCLLKISQNSANFLPYFTKQRLCDNISTVRLGISVIWDHIFVLGKVFCFLLTFLPFFPPFEHYECCVGNYEFVLRAFWLQIQEAHLATQHGRRSSEEQKSEISKDDEMDDMQAERGSQSLDIISRDNVSTF